MENYEYLYSASTAIYILSSIIIITANVLLYTKLRTTTTLTMLIGGALAFIFNIASILMGLVASNYDIEVYIKINAVLGFCNGLAYGMFCLGLLFFVVNDFEKLNSKKESF
nr:hypothetical protein [uncultured Psychroserpens sp.]